MYEQQAKRKASYEFSAHLLLPVPEEAQVNLMASSCSLVQPRTQRSTWAASNCGACSYTHTPKQYSTSQELNSTGKYWFQRSSKPPKYWKLNIDLQLLTNAKMLSPFHSHPLITSFRLVNTSRKSYISFLRAFPKNDSVTPQDPF